MDDRDSIVGEAVEGAEEGPEPAFHPPAGEQRMAGAERQPGNGVDQMSVECLHGNPAAPADH